MLNLNNSKTNVKYHTFNLKDIIIILSYFMFGYSFFFDQIYLIIFFAFITIILNHKNLYVFLILSPLIKPSLSIYGFTFTQVIMSYLYLKVIFIIIMRRTTLNNSIKQTIYIALSWTIIILLGVFNFYINYDYSQYNIIFENVIRILTVILPLIIFIDLNRFNNSEKNMLFRNVILYSTYILAIICLDVLIFNINSGSSLWINNQLLDRLTMSGLDVNHFSILLSIGILFPLFNIFVLKRLRIFSLLVLFLLIVTIILTYSKTGIIITFITALLFFYYVYKVSLLKKIGLIVSVVAFMGIIFLYYSENISILFSRFFDTYNSGGISGLTTYRYDLWINGITTTLQNNFLIGLGGSNHVGMNINYNLSGEYMVMHSMIISQFVEYGLIGLILYLSILSIIMKALISNYSKKGSVYLRFFISIILAYFIAGLAINFMFEFSVWLFLGIVLSYSNTEKIALNH